MNILLKTRNIFCLLFFLSASLIAQKKQTEDEYIALDVYLAEKYVGITPVYYTEDGTFWLEDVGSLIDLLKTDKKPIDLTEFFGGKIAKKREIEGVGSIEADFDVFRMRIILSEIFFETKKIDNSGVLKQSEHNANIKLDLVVSHQESLEKKEQTNFHAASDITFQDFLIRASGNQQKISESNQVENEFEEGSINWIVNRWHLSAGYLNSVMVPLMPRERFIGLSVNTEPNLLKRGNDLRGSVLEIFVPIRSLVEFYVDNRLIDSQTLSSGKQQVDTTKFPQGSYYVTVKIHAAGSSAIETRHYFAKSGYLTPWGFPQYHLELGKIRDNEKIQEQDFYLVGANFRLNNSVDVGVYGYGVDESRAYVLRFTSLIYNTILRGSHSWKEDSNRGVGIGVSSDVFGLNFSADFERTTLAQAKQLDSDTIATIDEFLEDELDLSLEENIRQKDRYSAVISKNIGKYSFKYNYYLLKVDGERVQYHRGPSIQYQIFNNRKHYVTAEMSYKLNMKDDTLTFGLSWRANHEKLNFTNSGLIRQYDQKQINSIVNRVGYLDANSRTGLGLRADINNQLDLIDGKRYDDYLSANLNQGTELGRFEFGSNTRFNKDTTSNSRRYAFGTSLNLDSSANFAIGPANLGESLVAVKIINIDNLADTEILVDNNVMQTVKGSKSVLIGVSPYTPVKVAIKPSESSPIIRYDDKVHEVLLYPGNVQHVEFKVEKAYIAIGRILDRNSTGLSYKKIEGIKELVFTEEDGSFQFEIGASDKPFIKLSDRICNFNLPYSNTIDYFFDFGDVRCQ